MTGGGRKPASGSRKVCDGKTSRACGLGWGGGQQTTRHRGPGENRSRKSRFDQVDGSRGGKSSGLCGAVFAGSRTASCKPCSRTRDWENIFLCRTSELSDAGSAGEPFLRMTRPRRADSRCSKSQARSPRCAVATCLPFLRLRCSETICDSIMRIFSSSGSETFQSSC